MPPALGTKAAWIRRYCQLACAQQRPARFVQMHVTHACWCEQGLFVLSAEADADPVPAAFLGPRQRRAQLRNTHTQTQYVKHTCRYVLGHTTSSATCACNMCTHVLVYHMQHEVYSWPDNIVCRMCMQHVHTCACVPHATCPHALNVHQQVPENDLHVACSGKGHLPNLPESVLLGPVQCACAAYTSSAIPLHVLHT